MDQLQISCDQKKRNLLNFLSRRRNPLRSALSVTAAAEANKQKKQRLTHICLISAQKLAHVFIVIVRKKIPFSAG